MSGHMGRVLLLALAIVYGEEVGRRAEGEETLTGSLELGGVSNTAGNDEALLRESSCDTSELLGIAANFRDLTAKNKELTTKVGFWKNRHSKTTKGPSEDGIVLHELGAVNNEGMYPQKAAKRENGATVTKAMAKKAAAAIKTQAATKTALGESGAGTENRKTVINTAKCESPTPPGRVKEQVVGTLKCSEHPKGDLSEDNVSACPDSLVKSKFLVFDTHGKGAAAHHVHKCQGFDGLHAMKGETFESFDGKTLTKGLIGHPNEASRSTGAIGMKRIHCVSDSTNEKCDVFKTGHCIKCQTTISVPGSSPNKSGQRRRGGLFAETGQKYTTDEELKKFYSHCVLRAFSDDGKLKPEYNCTVASYKKFEVWIKTL